MDAICIQCQCSTSVMCRYFQHFLIYLTQSYRFTLSYDKTNKNPEATHTLGCGEWCWLKLCYWSQTVWCIWEHPTAVVVPKILYLKKKKKVLQITYFTLEKSPSCLTPRSFYLIESILLCRCSVHYLSIILTNLFKSVQDPCGSYEFSEYVMNFCLILISTSARVGFLWFFVLCFFFFY